MENVLLVLLSQEKITHKEIIMVSKNSKANRGAGHLKRVYNGEVVQATYYYGKHYGHGAYMAGSVNGELITGKDGIPLPLRQVGSMELV